MRLSRIHNISRRLAIALSLASGCTLLAQTPQTNTPTPSELVGRVHLQNPQSATTHALADRAAALLQLMRTDPERALAEALPEQQALALRSSSAAAQAASADQAPASELVESWGDFSGELRVRVLDDFEHDHTRRLYSIRTPGGKSFEAHLVGLPESDQKCGVTVQASGIRLGNVIAARVSAVTPLLTSCSPIGEQKAVILLLNFQGSTLPATVTQASVRDLFFGATNSMDHHWRESSYGKTWATGDVFGPFNLQATNYTIDQIDDMETDAIAAADSTVNFALYNRIFLVYPNVFPQAGGIGTIGCGTVTSNDGNNTTSTSWLRADFLRDRNVCAAVHEGGHNLGLDHASSVQYNSEPLGRIGDTGTHDEYGDRFSQMGTCRLFNTSWVLGHYAAQHKLQLGWLNASTQQVNADLPATINIEPMSTNTAGVKTARIRRGPGNNRWVWIEYRQPTGYDSTLSLASAQVYNGALGHYEDPAATDLESRTRLIDFTAAATPGNFADPALIAGATWSDPYSPLSLVVNSANSTALNITVRHDASCATLNPSSLQIGPAANTGTITVTAPSNCSWAVTSNDSWLTVTSSANGTGNGSVSYSVTANSTGNSRTGSLTIARQNWNLTQTSSNSVPFAAYVIPNSGSSLQDAAQTFQFTFTDGNGAGDITNAAILFSPAGALPNACYAEWVRSGSQIRLYSDDGSNYVSRTIGSSITLSNSQCSLFVGNSAAVSSGNSVELTVRLSFRSAFAGSHSIRARVQDASGGDSGWTPLGSWNVTAGCAYSLSPTSANVAGTATTQTVSVSAGASCPWTAVSDDGWLTVTSGASGSGNGVVTYTVAANPTASARTGSLHIAGTAFYVTQQPGSVSQTFGLLFVPVTPCRLVDTRLPAHAPSFTGVQTRSFNPPSLGCGIPSTARAYSLNVTAVPQGPLPYITIWPTGQSEPNVSTLNSLDGRIKANAAIVPAGTNGSVNVLATAATDIILDINGYFVSASDPNGLAFYPLAPCRVADTRQSAGGFSGTRQFNPRNSGCNVPATARAYSLNTTVVPSGPLPYLTMYPAGQSVPTVSTLNALSGGIVANAAIVPAGTDGAVNVFNAAISDVILDINGYFAPTGSPGALALFNVAPCRIADTRNATGTFGGPVLNGTRDYPVTQSACSIPAAAQAYALNATVVPPGSFPYLTLYPVGQTLPTVSTLNALDGAITSNAAIVPAGSGNAIRAYAAAATHLILDISAYFAP